MSAEGTDPKDTEREYIISVLNGIVEYLGDGIPMSRSPRADQCVIDQLDAVIKVIRNHEC